MKILNEEQISKYGRWSLREVWEIDNDELDNLLQAQAELTRDETLKDQFSSSHYIDTGDYYKEDIPDSGPIEYPYLPDSTVASYIWEYGSRCCRWKMKPGIECGIQIG